MATGSPARRRRSHAARGAAPRISVTLDESVFARIEELADSRRESMSSVCSRMIEAYAQTRPDNEQLYLDLFDDRLRARGTE